MTILGLGYEFIEWTLDREGKVPVTNQTLTDPDTTVYAQSELIHASVAFTSYVRLTFVDE